jgi:beta-lactamase regulating signal transducer with metallopeptidase domain
MNALMYLIQVNLYLLLFYLFYVLLLHRETFFKMNRFYLVGSALLSLMIPLMKLQWVKEIFLGEQVLQVTQKLSNVIAYESVINNNIGNALEPGNYASAVSNLQIVVIIYGFITLLLLLNFLRKLYMLKQALYSNNKSHAYSFFNKIIVDDTLEGKDTIINHEMVHVKQWHSLDIIFFEIFTAFNWFNPIAFLYKKGIKDIHEFIADETAASTLKDKSAYTLLLVSNVFGAKPQQLTNNFFNQSLLKRRINMLYKTKSRQVAVLKYGLIVPLFVTMVIFSSATATAEKFTKAIEASPIIEVLSNSKISLIEEIKSPLLAIKVNPKKKLKSPTEQSKGNEIQAGATITQSGEIHLQNLKEYVRAFRAKQAPEEVRKEGLVYISFDVDDSKKASNFKVIKSIDPYREAKMLTYLLAFSDTVSLSKGTYNFYEGEYFGLPGDDHKRFLDKDIPTIFGTVSVITVMLNTQDETKSDAGRIVNYLKVPYLITPIILVDGKNASYKSTEKGLRLDETINMNNRKVIVLTGDSAVAAYNETARNGLILITTE